MTRWVLTDYGEVISNPMPAETMMELAALAGQQADEFRDRYWKFRRPMISASPTMLTGRLSLAASSRLSRN
jgi:hypothetical protein